MNFIQRTFIFCFIICNTIIDLPTFAQGPPDPGGGGGGSGPVGMGPIDGGIEITIALGLVLGVRNYYKNKKRKNVSF